MSTQPQELPHPTFLNPPVVEVVCGLQFPPIPQWLTTHYGLFWERVKHDYPRCEDQPPLGKIRLGDVQEPEELEISVVLPPLRRVFLIDESNSYLIQVQQNRFVHNWRKVPQGDYPRFSAAYARFRQQWQQFRSFLQSSRLSLPRVELYELNYVNLISIPQAVFPRDTWKFLNFYNEFPLTATGAPPRMLNLKVGWPLDGDIGKLALTVKHGKLPHSAGDFLMAEFSARGPADPDIGNMDSWFQAAHDAIVHTFAALTTKSAHKIWKRVR